MICIDENGSPYLAHAWFSNKKGSQKKDHKYYTRAEDKGRWRYFYSPEEFRKWSKGAKNAVQNVADKTGFKQRKELSDAKKEKGIFSGLKKAKAQNAYDNTALGKAEKAVRGAVDKVKDSVKPMSPKAKQTVGKIHEKFKDVTLDTIDLFANEATRNIRGRYEKSNHDPETIGLNMFLFLLPTAGVGKVGFGAMKMASDAQYNNSIYGKVSRWLDSPVAELHNKKYQQYAWKAGTTGFDKPKEIMSNAKKAWDERVKRDNARAKSMKRRGVSPQTLLR